MNAPNRNLPALPQFSETLIQAIQHVRRMRGGAQSHLMRANDGFCYVTKFMNNPQDVRVLGNELFATRLGQTLGIAVAEPAVVEVSPWLIGQTEELRCELAGQRIPFVSGPCFGSRFVGDPTEGGAVFDYLPESLLDKLSNLDDFAQVLVLDKWTCNSDGRQCVFALPQGHRAYRATLCGDFGYVLTAPANRSGSATSEQ